MKQYWSKFKVPKWGKANGKGESHGEPAPGADLPLGHCNPSQESDEDDEDEIAPAAGSSTDTKFDVELAAFERELAEDPRWQGEDRWVLRGPDGRLALCCPEGDQHGGWLKEEFDLASTASLGNPWARTSEEAITDDEFYGRMGEKRPVELADAFEAELDELMSSEKKEEPAPEGSTLITPACKRPRFYGGAEVDTPKKAPVCKDLRVTIIF